MENESLGLKSFKGVLWNVFGRVTNQGMGFIMGIILARMIAPESYGLIAMAMVVISLTGTLVDGGFSTALLRKKNPNAADYYSVFWFNIIVAIGIYLLIYLLAPKIESFYDSEGLISVVRWLSLSIIIRGVVGIHNIQLIKKLNFKAINIIAIIATLISGVIGVTMAYNGYGVDALISQQLSAAFISSIITIFYNRWLPKLLFSIKSFKELFGFGSKLLASGILNSIFENLYPLIIGRLFSPALLAYYSRANSYQSLFSHTLTAVVSTVSFPSLAPLQDDNERLKNAYRQMIRMVMLVNAPVMLGLMATAEPLIEFLITDKWLPTAPYLQVLCLAGLLYPLHAINLNIINVKGRSDIFLKLEVIKKIVVVIAIFAGLPWGVMGLVVANVASSFLSYFLNVYFSLKLVGYTVKEQLSDAMPYISLSIITAIIVWGFISIIPESLGFLLLVQLFVGLFVYIGGNVIFKLSAFKQLKEMLIAVLYHRR